MATVKRYTPSCVFPQPPRLLGSRSNRIITHPPLELFCLICLLSPIFPVLVLVEPRASLVVYRIRASPAGLSGEGKGVVVMIRREGAG